MSSSRVAHSLRVAEAVCARGARRLTPIRRQVLRILLEKQRCLKAYELLDEIRREQPGAAPPTVYRALDFLVSQGLAHRLDASNAWIACHDASGPPHDLLIVCMRCGSVAELTDPAFGQRLAEIATAAGFQLCGHETELRALCRRCRAPA